MKKFRSKGLITAFVALFSVLALTINFIVQASTVIDDTFADGESKTQNLSNNSLAYYTSRGSSATVDSRVDAVGSVTLPLGGSSDAIWAYFTNSGSPLTLSVGDTVTFTTIVQPTYTTSTAGGIRFGLFNSNGSRVTNNLTGGQNSANFGDDTGYAAEIFMNGSGNFGNLYRRDVVSPTAITNIFNTMATTGGFQPIACTGNPTTRQVWTSGNDYTLTYSVSKTSATVTQITVSATGNAVSESCTGSETSASPYASFDWFTLRFGNNTLASSLKFKEFKVDFNPAAPTITTQPAPPSQTVSVGANVQYSVGASGSNLAYQWLKDNNPITGNASATTANLQLTNVQTTDTGVYSVNVSNAGGTTPSNPVNLTVTAGPTDPPPVINQQPQNTTAVIGSSTSLSVTATGPNLTYQWFKNGNLIGGATSATLNFTNVQTTDTADYVVNVSNGGGTVPSNPARLTVVSAMTAIAFDPLNNSNGICTDKPLSITFNQTPKIGTSGKLRVYDDVGTLVDTIDMAAVTQTKTIGSVSAFRYFPIIIEGNKANIYLHTQLAYNKTYYVTIEPGILTDLSNAPFVGFSDANTFRFTTKANAPTAGTNVLTVNSNGTGDFCTIQGAVDFVPANNPQRVVINVKNGTYTEIIYIPSNKPLITVKGESRAGTIQQYANNNNLNGAISGNYRTSFGVDAADFNLENITLHNTTPQGGSQAEAIRTNGLRATLNSVTLLSYQDTILTQKSAFITNSYIEGDVDFMWGNGATFYKNTELKSLRDGGYYTQIRNASGTFGNVYVNCRFTKGAGITNGNYLGRIDPDDFPASQVVLIDSQMDTHIAPVGWLFNNPTNPVDATNYPNIRYWEFNSTALDGVTPIDCSSRHPISRNSCNNPLSVAEADFYRNPANVTGFTPSERLTAIVSLSNLSQTFDGLPKPVTVTTDPNVAVDVTYNGSATVPTNAGTYTVVATVNDPNYQGSASGTLTIAKANATVTLSNLTQTFDGTPKPVTVTINPAGLSYSATYNGSPIVPSAIGNYAVVVTVTDPNYTGSATGNLNIKSLVKAFPTAEGAGAYSIGGRGGDTYHVTNLNDSGAGSLRNGITSATGPRTIVFDLSGTIYLSSDLRINKSFLTISGQTAPGDGITVAGRTTVVDQVQHVIIRYLRFRGGDINCPSMQGDSFWVDKSKDVIVDHVSTSWSVDETLSTTESDRVTIQWAFITESLNNSCHLNDGGTGFERHGYGSLIRYGSGRISYHHNFYAHHFNRNPRVGDDITLDFVNNVIYDWGTDASYSGAANEGTTKINYVGNYLVAGPNTPAAKRARAFNGGSVNTLIYQNGNVIDSNVNGVHDGTNTGWAMFVNLYTQQNAPLDVQSGKTSDEKEPTNSAIDINAQTAETAFTQVVLTAGSSHVRDAVDARMVNDVRNETGLFINSQTEVGGFPMLNSLPAPVDTDQDGISDTYENNNGLNANDPTDAAQIAANGYTNLENYVNSNLFAPTAANVSVGGKVLSSNGGGISRVNVTLTNTATGEILSATTNSFGFYTFNEVPAGGTYVVTVSSRRYSFANPSQVVNVTENVSELNFVASN
jgi:Pectinesterase/MBG domain/Carboxypeptidase regulatory-like domain/Immunoglobulin domain/Bacterial Ig-like domain/Immunoglobulin I-set domain